MGLLFRLSDQDTLECLLLLMIIETTIKKVVLMRIAEKTQSRYIGFELNMSTRQTFYFFSEIILSHE